MSKKYTIMIDGCDDSTYFDMELSESELELVKRISKLSNETSTYGCMPTLDVEEIKNELEKHNPKKD